MCLDAPQHLVIASRESRLAMWQAEYVRARLLRLYPHCRVDILGVTTQGDRILDRPLAKIGGKGLFVKELETALAEGRAHLAVHSMKDVPMHLPEGFEICIVDEREDPRDALVSNRYAALAELPAGSVVGTSSLRRESQLRARFPQLQVEALRGNLDTRLRKLDEGRYAAIILAAAGLKRLGLESRIRACLDVEESIPAVGQGALGIEYRDARVDIASWLARLALRATTACVTAERAFSRRLAGSCEVPLGAHADIDGGALHLSGFAGEPDGSRLVRASVSGAIRDAAALGEALGERLLALGAQQILDHLAQRGDQ